MTADPSEQLPARDDTSDPESPRILAPRADLFISLGIVLATFAAYARVFSFGFVAFDDGKYIYNDIHLRGGLTFQTLKWVFLSFSPDNWFPVTRLSLLADYNLFGLRPNTLHLMTFSCYSVWEQEAPKMSRTVAALPAGSRITDYISLGVVAKTFPLEKIRASLVTTGKESVRQRDLPAHVVVYYVIALALYMQSSYREVPRCLLEGIQWLAEPATGINVAGNSGISQARTRLGWEPVRQLHDEVVRPVAVAATRGAWYRAWRLISLDGSTLDVADEKGNNEAFGRPGASRGESAYPKIRFVSLVENGTHVLFGSRMADYATSEIALAKTVMPSLGKGMLCLADRGFFGFEMWKQAAATGADLLWRVRKNIQLACEKRLPDGSYLSRIYPSQQDRRRGRNGTVVRVIEYRLEGVEGAEPLYRLATTILDPALAPAAEVAALYHERWEIETAFDELKTHLRGAHIVLRSKTPDLVRQEFYGLLMAHFADQ